MTERKKKYVLEMIHEAWQGYVRYAAQRARRLYQESHKGWFGRDPIRNVIASMGTLYITNCHQDFQKADEYVKLKLDITKLNDENIVGYFITDYIGGLLEVYALTQKVWYLDKAREIAIHIKKAYDSPSGR